MNQLCLYNIEKKYLTMDRPALSDFSYIFSDGIYGIVGPNGSGKSTLENIIVGNVFPNKGKMSFNGKFVTGRDDEYRNVLGFVPQHQNLYDYFTVERFLFYLAALKGIEKKMASNIIDNILKELNLIELIKEKIGTLSGGTKQRVLLAQALMNNPKILILDEPTVGLDPEERVNFRNIIRIIASDRIILFSTHIMSDIELIADEVLFFEKGIYKCGGRTANIIHDIGNNIFECSIDVEEYPMLAKIYSKNRIIGMENGKLKIKLAVETEIKDIENICIQKSEIVGLEDIYMYIYH